MFLQLSDFPDDKEKQTPPLSQTPEPSKTDPSETTSSDANTTAPDLPLLSESKKASLDAVSTLAPSAPVADVMDAPLPPRESAPTPQSGPEVPAYPAPLPDPFPTSSAQNTMDVLASEATEEVVMTEEEATVEEADASLDPATAQPSNVNGVGEVELERPLVMLPPCHLDDPLESPIVQPEELCLRNGLPLPAPRDPDAPVVSTSEQDDSPIAEPDVSQQPVVLTSVTEAAKQIVTDPTEPTDQSGPAHLVEDFPVKAVVQAEPAQPEAQDTVPKTVLDVKENDPVAQSDTREETSSPAEPVSTAGSTPEPMPAPPTSTAEEKEDTPSIQTVTPTHVEANMQGQCPPHV